VGDRERDCAAAGPNIDGGPLLRQVLKRSLDNHLCFRSRDQHTRSHGKLELSKAGHPRDVLERFPGGTPSGEGDCLGCHAFFDRSTD
jgi:hypothetical protein